jgi:cytochrome c-type biogenesis protein CcmE
VELDWLSSLVELSPRTAPGPSVPDRTPHRRSRWAYVVLVAVLVGVGFVAYQGLTSASLYFYNADEAYEQREELGADRIRIQGVVQDDIDATTDRVSFTIAFNGAEVPVVHDGDPPELFEPGIPVVLEGRWDPTLTFFESDEILVKHDEQYEADNSDRIADAEDGQTGDAPAP